MSRKNFGHFHIWVVVLNIFYFHPYLGKWSILTNIFQLGWNRQVDMGFKWEFSENESRCRDVLVRLFISPPIQTCASYTFFLAVSASACVVWVTFLMAKTYGFFKGEGFKSWPGLFTIGDKGLATHWIAWLVRMAILPWEPTTFIFRGHKPIYWGV